MQKNQVPNPWVLVAGLGCFFFHSGGYWSATWWSKWGFLMLAFNLFFSIWAALRTSWFYFPLMLWTLSSSTLMAFWAQKTYGAQFDPIIAIVLQKDALFAWVIALSVMWCFAQSNREWVLPARVFFMFIWGIAITVFTLMPKGMPPNNGWYFGNPSMAASLIAALLPSVWSIRKRSPLWDITAWCLTALVIWRIGASIPVGVLAVVTVAYLRVSWKTLASVAFLGIAGQLLLGKDFLDNNGRFEIYKMAFDWTREQGLFWFGWGGGAAQTVLPIVQQLKGIHTESYFMWLHSDWLQQSLEYGVFGFAFTLLAAGRLAYRSFSNRTTFAMLSGFAAMALFNYPLRMPITAFCLLMVCCEAERSRRGHRRRSLGLPQ